VTQVLAVLSGGVRDGRMYYVDVSAPTVEFTASPGRPAEHYVRSAPELTTSTALGQAVVFRHVAEAPAPAAI
jgi:hypothetical protein